MSEEYYQALIGEFQAIARDAIKTCPIPIEIYVQEAQSLHARASQDAETLTRFGLEARWIEQVAQRCGALQQAEINWLEEFNTRKDAQKQWAEQSPGAYQLRNDLLRNLRFALRNDPDGSKQVKSIAEGGGHADMVEDILRLAKLGQAHREALAALNFDLQRLDQAQAQADTMASLLAQINGERETSSERKVLRDQAFTFLKQAVDEVRDYGKFVFHDQPDMLKAYSSAFYRR